MNLGEIKAAAAKHVGLFDPSASDYFLLEADRLVNDANIQVAQDIEAPQNLATLAAHSGNNLEMPGDMMEDGLLEVVYDYDRNPVSLKIVTIPEIMQEFPIWMTSNLTGIPKYIIHDPRNPTYDLRMVPAPSATVNYAVMYRVRPLTMVNETDLPLAMSTDAGPVSALPDTAHELVVLQTAILFLQDAVYLRDRAAGTIDGYASKLKMWSNEYDKLKAKATSGMSTDTITMRNPMYRPRVGC